MAVVLYGVERATFDIDIAIGPTVDDVALLLDILGHLGYSEIVNAETGEGIASIDNTHPDDIIEAKSVRVKNGHSVDILIVPGGTFDFMWEHRVEVQYKGVTIPIPSLVDLIHLKEQSGRPIDVEDAKALRHILRTKKHK